MLYAYIQLVYFDVDTKISSLILCLYINKYIFKNNIVLLLLPVIKMLSNSHNSKNKTNTI